jgi:hypothetical protein
MHHREVVKGKCGFFSWAYTKETAINSGLMKTTSATIGLIPLIEIQPQNSANFVVKVKRPKSG